MKVTIELDRSCHEERLNMRVWAITDKVNQIRRLAEGRGKFEKVVVEHEGRSYVIAAEQLTHLVADHGGSLLFVDQRCFVCRDSLKMFEQRFAEDAETPFVRISKFCIANVDHIDCFEAGFSGNLLLKFKNGRKETVSRRYVNDLKKRLF
ncbi:MAG: LytTR family DNA-binding domain-containing protein [Sporolactobacillus sp.]